MTIRAYHPIPPGVKGYVPAIDARTIVRRRRMAHMAPIHAKARESGLAAPEGVLRKAWREACRLYPGDDGVRNEDVLAAEMVA